MKLQRVVLVIFGLSGAAWVSIVVWRDKPTHCYIANNLSPEIESGHKLLSEFFDSGYYNSEKSWVSTRSNTEIEEFLINLDRHQMFVQNFQGRRLIKTKGWKHLGELTADNRFIPGSDSDGKFTIKESK